MFTAPATDVVPWYDGMEPSAVRFTDDPRDTEDWRAITYGRQTEATTMHIRINYQEEGDAGAPNLPRWPGAMHINTGA